MTLTTIRATLRAATAILMSISSRADWPRPRRPCVGAACAHLLYQYGEVFTDAAGVGGVGGEGEVSREGCASFRRVFLLVVEEAELAEGVGVGRIERGRALVALDGPSHIVVLLRRHLLGP